MNELDTLGGDLSKALTIGNLLSGLNAIVGVPGAIEDVFDRDLKPLIFNRPAREGISGFRWPGTRP